MDKAVLKSLQINSRPALSKRIMVRCTAETVERIDDLLEFHPMHKRSSLARTALLVGLMYLEEERKKREEAK